MRGVIVDTRYGEVEGIRMKACCVFKGIPYAKPPIGERRWKAPERAEKFEGMYKADSYGNRCPQLVWDSPDNIYI